MFANYNFTKYHSDSIVSVKLNKNIIDDNDFNDFLTNWLWLYELKKDFSFVFDCEDVGYIPIKYCFKMSMFIKSLRKRDYQYLQKSIIFINNPKVKRLLDIILYIQPPVAPVYIINDKNLIEEILKNNIPENTEIILPSKSFLNLF